MNKESILQIATSTSNARKLPKRNQIMQNLCKNSPYWE
jgi:hypothetical protein